MRFLVGFVYAAAAGAVAGLAFSIVPLDAYGIGATAAVLSFGAFALGIMGKET